MRQPTPAGAKAAVDQAKKTGATPLMTAAIHDHPECVQALLHRGPARHTAPGAEARADISHRPAGLVDRQEEEEGATALYVVAVKGHTECLRSLLVEFRTLNPPYHLTPLVSQPPPKAADFFFLIWE